MDNNIKAISDTWLRTHNTFSHLLLHGCGGREIYYTRVILPLRCQDPPDDTCVEVDGTKR